MFWFPFECSTNKMRYVQVMSKMNLLVGVGIKHKFIALMSAHISSSSPSVHSVLNKTWSGWYWVAMTLNLPFCRYRQLCDVLRLFLKWTLRHDFLFFPSFKTEIKRMSVFKNYEPGEPTCRLYVKNIAKQVEEKVSAFIALDPLLCVCFIGYDSYSVLMLSEFCDTNWY